jgi:hypothetical protein
MKRQNNPDARLTAVSAGQNGDQAASAIGAVLLNVNWK